MGRIAAEFRFVVGVSNNESIDMVEWEGVFYILEMDEKAYQDKNGVILK